jgi:DNA-directed RNA polymerase specialized sigma24 family protein
VARREERLVRLREALAEFAVEYREVILLAQLDGLLSVKTARRLGLVPNGSISPPLARSGEAPG